MQGPEYNEDVAAVERLPEGQYYVERLVAKRKVV